MPRISLERAAGFYGVRLPELHRTGEETRSKCFLACGRTQETGNRALAIQEGHPAKQWACHEYGCTKGGNLVGLCDLMKGGATEGGRPRGARFREIASDLQAMVDGAPPPEPSRPATTPPPAPESPDVNVPLAKSPNERARGLVNLDAKFVVDVTAMSPTASAYFRKRPFLSPEACRSWRVGYLPRDAGGDHSGGTMRGKIVYAYNDRDGNLLTWFGRDPDFEAKKKQWDASGRTEREPEKFHFVKGFHRGVELYGQDRIAKLGNVDRLKSLGLIVVEGPNDAIRLSTLNIPAVALCSNKITREQAERVAELAHAHAGGVATILLDCDAEGENGMKQALGYLAQLVPVRLGWTSRMHGGKFRDRQPESLTEVEWAELERLLHRHPSSPSAPRMTSVIDPPPVRLPPEDPYEFL